jgi:cation:H+ antiporter
MITSVGLFLVGLLVLYYGAEWLIRGASSLALQHGIRPVVIGLTVVALGTSMPEFLVNAVAAFYHEEQQVALGNIIGSNICNIALILGTSAVVLPLAVTPQILRKEYPMMLGTMVVFYAISLDGLISQWDGLLLITILAGLGYHLYRDAQKSDPPDLVEDVEDELEAGDPDASAFAKASYVIGGSVGLAVGANLMVDNAIHIANAFGIDHVVIGLTIVAIGTSLPELAASMVGALKSESDLSVGNVLGSNLLNVLFVVGVVSSMRPLEVQTTALWVHFPVMLGFCALLFPLAWTQYTITRLEGGVLLAGFFGYMTYLVMPYF